VENTRFVVLADDLTSAAEAAGHLADTGRPASVLLAPTSAGVGWPCVDLDSRWLPEPAAAYRHARAVELLPAEGIYKTMDSSLRGNWAAELAAVMRASGRSLAVVAPACPAYDRRTVGGHQLANGIPVHLGPAGCDPVRPVTDSSVVRPIVRQGLTVTSVTPGNLALDGASGVLVVDASTAADLELVAAAVGDRLGEIVLCGSPGLWEALHPVAPRRRDLPVARKALVLIGSLHPTTREQLAKLASSGVPVLTTDNADDVVQLFATATTVAVATPAASAEGPHLSALNEIGVRCAAAVPDLGFVLSGGDTARGLALALHAKEIRAAGTIAPGIMLGTLIGPNRPVITKAGGFGDADTLITAVDALTSSPQVPDHGP
jgi:D-threonate/D-erythronate kinase